MKKKKLTPHTLAACRVCCLFPSAPSHLPLTIWANAALCVWNSYTPVLLPNLKYLIKIKGKKNDSPHPPIYFGTHGKELIEPHSKKRPPEQYFKSDNSKTGRFSSPQGDAQDTLQTPTGPPCVPPSRPNVACFSPRPRNQPTNSNCKQI